MTKRLVEIDDVVLAEAREALGAATIKETVNRALLEVTALTRRREFLADLLAGGLPDLADPSVMDEAWR